MVWLHGVVEPTCGVHGQVNLNEVCVDGHLRGVSHVWLEMTQNLYAEFRNEMRSHLFNDNILTTQHKRETRVVWLKVSLHVLVGAAVQILCDET